MTPILKRLGIYKALHASAVQFNSIVFRVVVGVLAEVPGEIIALITTIEFILNFILEVPTGYLSDRLGRVRLAIAGHITVILGLSCGYTALLGITSPTISYALFVCHGFFIGFTRPLTSGSVEAFYQDALKRNCTSAELEDAVNKSFTLSKLYGKYLTTIAVLAAFLAIYIFHKTIGAHHAFIIGIILWGIALWKLIDDYRKLGDLKQTPSEVGPIFRYLVSNRRALNSMFYALSHFMMFGIVMGYFIVALGREVTSVSPFFKWMTIVAFMIGSQGLGWIAKSHVLPKLINKMTEKSYLTFFYSILFAIGLGLVFIFPLLSSALMAVAILIFGAVFFLAVSAIQGVSQNMILSEVGKEDYAMILSIQNMPGLLFIGLYSLYLTIFKNGCPSVREVFVSLTIISVTFLVFHLVSHKDGKKIVAEAIHAN